MDSDSARVLAIVSHDLRQPLQAAMLYLNALDRRIEGDEVRDILKRAERSTTALSDMLTTLHEYARVYAQGLAPSVAAVALSDALRRAAVAFPSMEIEATTIEVQADPMLLDVALRHLIANAAIHGRSPRIAVKKLTEACAEIVVSDDGPGIAPEDQARIFEPFVQLNKQGGGMGLGLAVVKRAAALMEAPLELTSTPGRGARFALRLPIAT